MIRFFEFEENPAQLETRKFDASNSTCDSGRAIKMRQEVSERQRLGCLAQALEGLATLLPEREQLAHLLGQATQAPQSPGRVGSCPLADLGRASQAHTQASQSGADEARASSQCGQVGLHGCPLHEPHRRNHLGSGGPPGSGLTLT